MLPESSDPQLVRVGCGGVVRQHLGEAVGELPGGIEVESIRGGAGNRISQGLQFIARQQREPMVDRGEGVEGESGVGGWVSVGEIFLAEQFLETMEARGVGEQLDDLRRGRCGGLASGVGLKLQPGAVVGRDGRRRALRWRRVESERGGMAESDFDRGGLGSRS